MAQNTKPNTPAASANAKNVSEKQVPKLREIGADETFSPGIKHLEPGRIEGRYAVRPDEKSERRFEVVTIFDFRSASPAEIQELAMRACVIEAQRKWRAAAKSNLASALAAPQWSRVNVKTDIIDAARKTADPVSKAKSAVSKAFAGLSDDARAALLAELAAMNQVK